jgi:GT2 family glycosyltransferase
VLQHRAPGDAGQQAARLARHAAVVRAYLTQRGEAEIAVEPRGDSLRVSWQMAQPLVSIIIPTKNNLHYLRRCITTLLEKTDYPRCEIVLMDDHSTDPAVQAYYTELRGQVANLRIVENEPGSFNYSRVNNLGARQAGGELLLFLNNDVEILTPDWLSELVRWVQEPGVGMAGARLLYPDGAIQHAGIVIGMTGHANHVFAGKVPVQRGPFLTPDTLRNVSAVTGACMLVRRTVFEQVGGFNEELSLVFNDVELCLRVINSGWRVVYAPAAALIHYEGRSRARYIPPANIRLGAALLRAAIRAGDRYYNPNLSDEVNWPTLRRASQPGRLWMLDQIVRYKGE